MVRDEASHSCMCGIRVPKVWKPSTAFFIEQFKYVAIVVSNIKKIPFFSV